MVPIRRRSLRYLAGMKSHVVRVGTLAVLLFCLGACKKGVPLTYHRVALPGFSVQVPTQVNYQADLVATYRSGKVEWKDRSRQILVSWRRGVALTPEDVPAIVKAIGGLAPASAGQFLAESGAATASGLAGFQVTLKNAKYRIQFFEAPCGKRVVTIAAAARTTEMPALWDKLTSSIICAPQAEQEAKLDTGAPITPNRPELLAGWERMADDSAFIISHDERVIVAEELANFEGLTAPTTQPMLQTLVSQFGGAWVPGHSEAKSGPFGRREVMFGALTVDDVEFHAAVSIFRCDGQKTGLFLLVMGEKDASTDASSDATTQAALAELSTEIRCATPGDPPLRLAPPESPDGPTGEN